MSTRASVKEMAGSQRQAGEKTEGVVVRHCRVLLAISVHGETAVLQLSWMSFCQQRRLGFVFQQGFAEPETVTSYLAAVWLKHSPVLSQPLILTLCQSCSCKLSVSLCGCQNWEKKKMGQWRKVFSLPVGSAPLSGTRCSPTWHMVRRTEKYHPGQCKVGLCKPELLPEEWSAHECTA